MNEALEDENCKYRYVLSDLRSDRFKDMRWEVNHGEDGELLIWFLKGHVYPVNGIVWK